MMIKRLVEENGIVADLFHDGSGTHGRRWFCWVDRKQGSD